MLRCLSGALVMFTLSLAWNAAAQPAPDPAPAPSSPYSLPWLLRPAAAKTVVRSDTSIGLFDGGTAVASTLLGGVSFVEGAGVYLKGSYNVLNPDDGDSGSALANPALIGLYVHPLSPEVRFGFALGFALPFGQGGGNDPDPLQRAAVLSGIASRSGMENAMFAPNYFTPFGGVDLAYVAGGLTLQGELTLLQLLRVKGEDLDGDSSRTNSTAGLHVGYAFIPQLVASVELHYQRWLSTPAPVEQDASRREQATALIGVRVPFKAATLAISPGVSYSRAIDEPMSKDDWQIIQIDVPVAF